MGIHDVRVVLSTWGSRGDVEPLAGLAVRLREFGAEVQVCAPPDEKFVAPRRVELTPGCARPATGGHRPGPGVDGWGAVGGGPGPVPVAGREEARARAAGGVDPAGRTPAPGGVGGVPRRRRTAGVRGLRQ